MERLGWFSISDMVCAQHTEETKKIWISWVNKTDNGRRAVIKYAESLGFVSTVNVEDEISKKDAQDAFNYLLAKFPHTFGVRSYIAREAIINHS